MSESMKVCGGCRLCNVSD